MKTKSNKEDRFVSEIMKDFQMENPSEGFTNRVMQNIQLDRSIPVIDKSPLIGKAGWIGIAASLVFLLIFLFVGNDPEAASESGWLFQKLSSIGYPSINFSFHRLFNWINLESPTLFWIFSGIGALMLLVLLERLIDNFKVRYYFIF